MPDEIKKIDEVIKEFITAHQLGEKLDAQKVIIEFENIMGTEFCKRARAVRIDNGVLFLEVINSVWRQELFYQKALIMERLNAALGPETVRDIVFR